VRPSAQLQQEFVMKIPFPATAAATILAHALLWAPALRAQSAPQYRITNTIALGAPDRWDYLTFDPATHRVYVAHGDRVTVVDGHDGRLLGEVTGFPGGTHGIALVGSVGRGYTDDGQAGEAGSFSLETLKVGKRIKAMADADGIVFDTSSGHVFVINGDAGSLTVIDPASDNAVATVTAGTPLEFGVSGENGKLYVDGVEKNEIVRVDTRSNLADAHWPMPGCSSPRGLAIDRHTHRLFASCGNKVLMVIDAESGEVLATMPIGAGTDSAAFDPKRRRAFSSNGQDGTLSIIQEQDAHTFVALGSVPTASLARTMTIDPDTGRLFLVTADIDVTAPVVSPTSPGPHRRRIVPGSVKLLFMDPVN
jgi:YVTN family beta-propeller protein